MYVDLIIVVEKLDHQARNIGATALDLVVQTLTPSPTLAV
ncbi:hypothetical protein CCUS01_07177 [Colletotrichum cuscutae]|uniref:Uncharacterized protein n=1 Tax=Colletotrichum cuscutae TaxID=1209917 RepID=A0AAI9UZD6_9PEZI|nr:hypothetical protein CCUS01_07177 [Colletotrichum cuscutae]